MRTTAVCPNCEARDIHRTPGRLLRWSGGWTPFCARRSFVSGTVEALVLLIAVPLAGATAPQLQPVLLGGALAVLLILLLGLAGSEAATVAHCHSCAVCWLEQGDESAPTPRPELGPHPADAQKRRDPP